MTTEGLTTIYLNAQERDLVVSCLQTEWTRLDQARPAAWWTGREAEQPLIDKMNLIDGITGRMIGRSE